MSEDLYESINPVNPENQDQVEAVPETSGGEGLSFGIVDIPPLETILTHLLIFSLVWTVMYSVYFMILFFYYNVKHHDREAPRLKSGYQDGFLGAVKIWTSNLIFVLIMGLYALLRTSSTRYFWGFLAMVAFLAKIFYYDLRLIPKVRDRVNEIYTSIANTIKKLTERQSPKE